MQRAYDQANEVINLAASQAQEIVDAAVIEANELKESATQYTDSLLAHVEEVTSHYINQSDNEYNRLISSLNECVETVRANRSELYPQTVSEAGATTDYIPLQNTAPVKSDSIVDLDLI